MLLSNNNTFLYFERLVIEFAKINTIKILFIKTLNSERESLNFMHKKCFKIYNIYNVECILYVCIFHNLSISLLCSTLGGFECCIFIYDFYLCEMFKMLLFYCFVRYSFFCC